MPATNFTPIQLYRSTTASQVPTSGNLSDGELAINTNDEKLYFKNSGGTVKLLASSAGASGDVVGPASATDNAVVRFDGTTGKLVQNSVVTIADSTGDVAGVGTLTMGGNLTLSGGTANGVLYLNGSKVATSGSAFTFSGTAFSVGDGSTQSVQTINGGTTGGAVKGQRAGVNQWFVGDTAAALGSGSGLINFVYNNDPFIWSYAGTELMRLTSTGLGIGTSSPGTKLDIADSSGGAPSFRITNSVTSAWMRLVNTGGGNAFIDSNVGFAFRVGGSYTTAATLDSSGNLGLGVTPSAWGGFANVLQIGDGGSIAVDKVTPRTRIVTNAYSDGSNWIYLKNGFAGSSVNNSGDGSFAWYTAPSGFGYGTAATSLTSTQNGNSYTIVSAGTTDFTLIGAANNNPGTTFTKSGGTGTGTGTVSQNITFTQAMTLDASGNLGVGETSIAADTRLHLKSAGDTKLKVETTNNTLASGNAALVLTTGSYGYSIQNLTTTAGSAGVLRFYDNTAAVERARITSGGYFKASNNGSYLNSTASYHETVSNVSNDRCLAVVNTNASLAATVAGIQITYTASSPNNTTNNFVYGEDSTAQRFGLRSNGGLANYQSNNVDLSDIRTKTDINPLASYWNKIAALEIVTYKYKDQTHDDLNIGVIAQQVEQVAPEFVDPEGFGETPEDGVPLKTIYNKDLTFAAIKALQEAMARIETLEAKVSALEGN